MDRDSFSSFYPKHSKCEQSFGINFTAVDYHRQELLTITRAVFGAPPGSTFVFETSDLNICQDASVEIHPAAWEAVALTVSTIVVKNRDRAFSRGEREGYRFSLPKFAYIYA